jgi:hypothetical protein
LGEMSIQARAVVSRTIERPPFRPQ